jgi:hypothetical protein
MRRWASSDGLAWEDGGGALRRARDWERGLSNMAVSVDDDSTWRMVYTGTDAPPAPQCGYAWSPDGLRLTRCEGNPVVCSFHSPYSMVERGTLKLADNGTDGRSLVAPAPGVGDSYVVQAKVQRYAGATTLAAAVPLPPPSVPDDTLLNVGPAWHTMRQQRRTQAPSAAQRAPVP